MQQIWWCLKMLWNAITQAHRWMTAREEESATKEQGAVHAELQTTPQCCQRRRWRLPNKYQVSKLDPDLDPPRWSLSSPCVRSWWWKWRTRRSRPLHCQPSGNLSAFFRSWARKFFALRQQRRDNAMELQRHKEIKRRLYPAHFIKTYLEIIKKHTLKSLKTKNLPTICHLLFHTSVLQYCITITV